MTRLWFAAAIAVPAVAIAAAPAKTAVRSNFRIIRPFVAGLVGERSNRPRRTLDDNHALPQRSDRHRSNAHADLSASSTALERAPLAGKREAGAGDAPLHGLRTAILSAGNSSPPPPRWASAARSFQADRLRPPLRFGDAPSPAREGRRAPFHSGAGAVPL